jgi:uncharacterized protein YuzE
MTYDPEADAIYVKFRDRQGQVRTRELHSHTLVDEDDDGVVGVELLSVSHGVNLEGVTRADDLRSLLRSLREIPQPA